MGVRIFRSLFEADRRIRKRGSQAIGSAHFREGEEAAKVVEEASVRLDLLWSDREYIWACNLGAIQSEALHCYKRALMS